MLKDEKMGKRYVLLLLFSLSELDELLLELDELVGLGESDIINVERICCVFPWKVS